MEPDFWLKKWRAGQTGFHGASVHEDLLTNAERFLGDGPHRVLVPLCGKSVDLDWLLAGGHEVIGIELSPLAIEQVVLRLGGTPVQDTFGPLERTRLGPLTMLRGDVLTVTPELLGPVDRIWDRAALVALPPSMRGRYTATLRSLLRPQGLLLQKSFAYDQSKMSGPPFSVAPDEVAGHYTGWEIEPIDTRTLTEGKFAERGVSEFVLSVTLLRKP